MLKGQRRYVESLSSYARQFLDKNEKKPNGILLKVSARQFLSNKRILQKIRDQQLLPEIYDYMRVLFARIGVPILRKPIKLQPISEMVDKIKKASKNNTIYIYYPNCKR